jgi:hypothetical protein
MRLRLRFPIALMTIFALVSSCANKESAWTDPLEQKFIADVAPLSPPHSRSLQSYALTLPIFEMTDQTERIRWVSSSDLRSESHDQLVLVGDGAQSSAAIQRVSSVDLPDQRIRLTIAAQGGGPDPTYELMRVQGGWRRTGLKREEGAWDKIYKKANANRTVNKEAQQDAS